ncbi:hypothetical protein F4556_002055 [Kitasatospora gansuensis]|uniref:Uncharacterized protein n=1 Tax=Kitasatospora gansuensis TaxID=258050 RepID=A0A7W7S9S4_9ACTN|nr:hypothetical protein [Kitasatospora gansuensis]MBB4946520.1 hypothetical protein [Kitasatospora gansuensis]
MRVLAYEVRRLRGLRSTWLILAAVLLADAAVAAVLARQLPVGQLGTAAAVRCVTAVVPLLPLPIAALGAGALGALSYGHEVRYPGLPAGRVSYRRRLGLLVAKLAVTGVLAVLLAAASVLLDAAVLRLLHAPGARVAALFDPASAGFADALRPLLLFVGLTALAGWSGLLVTSLVRSAAAGLLILCAVPALLEPVLSLLLRQSGRVWPAQLRELLPFQYGLDLVRGADAQQSAVSATLDGTLLTAVSVPAVLLLLAGLLVQARRRAL